MSPWCSGYRYCKTSFRKVWMQILRWLKPCSRRVKDLKWWEFLTMVPAGNEKTLFLGQPYHKNNSLSSSMITGMISRLFPFLFNKWCLQVKLINSFWRQQSMKKFWTSEFCVILGPDMKRVYVFCVGKGVGYTHMRHSSLCFSIFVCSTC